MGGPLEGVRIVDLSMVVAGPVCTMLLAEQGAEVIKVESLAGDILRHSMQFVKNGMNSLTINCNRGKKSIAVDMKTPEGLAIVKELIADADVVVQNFRAGAAERLGLHADELRSTNERLITVWMSGYGQSGPMAHDPVFDPVIQAVTGHAAVQMNPMIPFPDVHRTILIDKSTALTAAQAVTAALFARERTGRGQHIDLSMIDSALYFFWPDGAMRHAMLDDDIEDGITLYDSMSLTQCADGHLVYFMAGLNHWHGVFRALGHPEWVDDPRAASLPELLMPETRQEFVDKMLDAMLGFDRDNILARLQAEDVPSAPVLSVDEVPSHPQIIHNGKLHEWEHPAAGKVRQPAAAANFSDTPAEPQWMVPMLGDHTDEILGMIGRDGAAIAGLREAGVVA